MPEIMTHSPTVVRNSLGLAVAGTRITLYDVMDYLTDGWPPKLIQHWLNLTDTQIADVMAYIENNRAEVETEYQQVVAYAEELRQYWTERNRERFAQIAKMPRRPGQEKLWAKLDALKARIAQE